MASREERRGWYRRVGGKLSPCFKGAAWQGVLAIFLPALTNTPDDISLRKGFGSRLEGAVHAAEKAEA